MNLHFTSAAHLPLTPCINQSVCVHAGRCVYFVHMWIIL